MQEEDVQMNRLVEKLPGLSALLAPLRTRAVPLPRVPGLAGRVDVPAMRAAIAAAGPEGSSRWLIAIVSTYEQLARQVRPEGWHTIPGLREFVKETGQYIPMIPGPILEQVRAHEGTVISPRMFKPAWEADGQLVEPALIDPAALLAELAGDAEAEAFAQRGGASGDTVFLRYGLWYHSLETARALGAERIIDFGASGTEFARFLVARHPDAEVCVVNDTFADGLSAAEPGIWRLGAPPFELGLFDDESVDLVVAHNRFERLPGLADRRAIAEVERVLVRGGRFVIAPFMVADQHALMVSPFSCFIANGGTDYASAIEAEIRHEHARIDFNLDVVTPISRRYDLGSALRRLVRPARSLTARLRPLDFLDEGFDDTGDFTADLFGLTLRRALFDSRAYLAMEFIKH